MNENHRENFSILFSFIIILATTIIAREFLVPLIWASIIALATWPYYERVHKYCLGNDIVASSVMVFLLVLLAALPVSWLVTELVRDIQWFSKYLITANKQGVPIPAWVSALPFGKAYIVNAWHNTLGQPMGVEKLLTQDSHGQLAHWRGVARSLGTQVAHRSIVLGFSFLCLFFFYKDGHNILEHVNAMGRYFLRERWLRYSRNVPGAINATLNGLVFVGLGVGVIMGVLYAFLGVPAPALMGSVTAVLAMIPFGVPFAFAFAAILLVTQAKVISALVVVIVGTLIMFIADHFVRPAIIGGATRLPFLAVFIGILGGVRTFGVVGLFLGPIVMVLFVTLWHEADIFCETQTPLKS